MTVGDLMRTSVMTVERETPLKNVARILSEFAISGLPVVDADGVVVGVVSETDILFKQLVGNGTRARLVDVLSGAERSRRRKSEAQTAGEAMTSPAITIAPDASLADAARTMLEHAVNRLPVTENGQLVGIVARADLVRAFTRSDEEIANDVNAILTEGFSLEPTAIIVEVSDGRVTVAGEVDSTETAKLLEETLRELPGVVSVNAALMARSDDRDFSDVPFF
jgi:CBS domain-containing protein